ncbi:MAG: DUF433 domain-containing protein [Cyanobacteriota bacterium]
MAASPAQERTPAPTSTSATADPGQVALDAETIQHLHSTLRALPRPHLESLTRAFRKRFQVPEEAVTIADRINQRCHHDWIETFLEQHQPQPGRAVRPLSWGGKSAASAYVWPMAFPRISHDPAVMGGKPCIRGLRITVSTVVGLIASGSSRERILQAYPQLEAAEINEALASQLHRPD